LSALRAALAALRPAQPLRWRWRRSLNLWRCWAIPSALSRRSARGVVRGEGGVRGAGW